MGLFSNKKEKLVAIFDIGSGSVGGALVKMPSLKDSIPIIIRSTRTDIVTRKELDFDVFLKDMILALGFASKALYNSKIGAPDEIICVLASPWYVTETRIIKMSKEHSFNFTKKIVDELLNKEIGAFNEMYKSKYGDVESAPEVIEHPILGVSLNGYIVDEPIGKKTRSVEMNMLISLAPKICLDKIRETLGMTFHNDNITFSSFMMNSFLAVRDRYMNHDSYLLLDIGGEITDIAIVSKGILKESLSFPYGRKSLLRDISNKLKMELRDAKEIFSLYNSGVISQKEKIKLEPILNIIIKSWSSSFRECLNSLPKTITLPSAMFITVDSDVRDWFMKVINNNEYLKSSTKDKQFTIVPLDGPEFLHMCDINNSDCDPFLIIESISAKRKMELYD